MTEPPTNRANRATSTSSSLNSTTGKWSGVSNAEEALDIIATETDAQIVEEIEEIKRYEDFTTIDWVQDAARAQLRRKARRQEQAGIYEKFGRYGWRRRLWDAYDAGQAWIVVTLVGIAIGLNAAFLSIATEWLSDIRLGHCTTAFYLNENFCCWEAENGEKY